MARWACGCLKFISHEHVDNEQQQKQRNPMRSFLVQFPYSLQCLTNLHPCTFVRLPRDEFCSVALLARWRHLLLVLEGGHTSITWCREWSSCHHVHTGKNKGSACVELYDSNSGRAQTVGVVSDALCLEGHTAALSNVGSAERNACRNFVPVRGSAVNDDYLALPRRVCFATSKACVPTCLARLAASSQQHDERSPPLCFLRWGYRVTPLHDACRRFSFNRAM